MPRKVIFHADDFNLTENISKGIIDAAAKGPVRSTSIMTNIPGIERNVRMLAECPALDVGVHLNLTFGQPLLKTENNTLTDTNGKFIKDPDRLDEYADICDIYREANAQVEKALEMGLEISHLDSHHHVHLRSNKCRTVMMEIAQKYNLAMRCIDGETRSLFLKNGIGSPGKFIGDFYGTDGIAEEALEKILSGIGEGITEIMCHPGYSDENLRRISSYSDPREAELLTLTSVKTKDAIKRFEITVTNCLEILQCGQTL